MNSPHYLAEAYATERVKTLAVWAQFRDGDLGWRLEPRARSPREQMVHQCLSEEAWMVKMLGIAIEWPPLPAEETRAGFIAHYAEASDRRLKILAGRDGAWFDAPTTFFDLPRSRGWVMVRRLVHTAHHRGQLTAYLRALGRPLHSTYGPTADTGGLPADGAAVIYPAPDAEALVSRPDGPFAPLPGPGPRPPTERP